MVLMTITPNPVPSERASLPDRPRTSYDWTTIALGQWQNWLTIDEDVDNAEAMRRSTRVRIAAVNYAVKRGLRVQSRRTDHGRTLDLKFTEVTQHPNA